MIVPLEVLVDQVDRVEFEDHETEFYGTKGIKISTPTYRVKVSMLDVERSRVVEMPWRSSDGKNEELTSAVALETLGVDPYTEDLEPKTISMRARITVEIL